MKITEDRSERGFVYIVYGDVARVMSRDGETMAYANADIATKIKEATGYNTDVKYEDADGMICQRICSFLYSI